MNTTSMSDTARAFRVNAAAFRRALGTAERFSSTDDALPFIYGVYLHPVPDGVQVIATDRFSMCWETLEIVGEACDVMIELPVIQRLLKALEAAPADEDMDTDADTVVITALPDGTVRVDLDRDYRCSLVFTPREALVPDVLLRKMEQPAEAAGDGVSDLHIAPNLLARASRAIADREPGAPVHVHVTGSLAPVRLTCGPLSAIVMPMRVSQIATAENREDAK